MERCESERSMDGAVPGAVEGAVAAAMEGGVTMAEIVTRVCARGGEGSGSDEGRSATCADGLIGLRREAGRVAEEWQRTREPGAEGGDALAAIEILRALTLRTVAVLSARAEPVSAVDLGRLSLTLQRIEGADGLRIERERAAAGAGLSHAGEVQRSGRSIEENPLEWPVRAVEEAPDFEWAGDSGGDPDDAPPAPAPDAPADDGGAQDIRAVPDAPDEREYSVARDVEMRRRDRARLLWPTDPPFCPALWHTFW